MKLQNDYSMLYKIKAGRVQYANEVVAEQFLNAGKLVTTNPKARDFSFKVAADAGQIATTPSEVDTYIASIISQVTSTPNAPSILSSSSGNEHILIEFTAGSDGGRTITNYEYSLNGGDFIPFSPQQISSPLLITGLTNDTTYSVKIRAYNANGSGVASSPVTETPTGINTFTAFTTVGTTTWTAPTYTTSVTYLIVGGGGGSGGAYDSGGGGGGGAGLVLTGTVNVIGGQTYTIIVGDGGAAGTSNRITGVEPPGGTGETSQFGSIAAVGGEGGLGSRKYKDNNSANRYKGGVQASNPTSGGGGSGGGGGGRGGGGGGNGSPGIDGNAGTNPGKGGNGVSITINGVTATYGAGGDGSPGNIVTVAVAGTANTGNGAKAASVGGSSQANGAKGGSGYVALQYNQ